MIKHIKCDIFKSDADVICHQVNCKKAMGRGIAGQIRSDWPIVYADYCNFIDHLYANNCIEQSKDLLGCISWTKVGLFYIVNFFSQDEYYPRDKCHTDYVAFKMCCMKLKRLIGDKKYTIGFPYKIGCGLAGGD